MKCPYCQTAINTDDFDETEVYKEGDGSCYWHFVSSGKCPECFRLLVIVYTGENKTTDKEPNDFIPTVVHPKLAARPVETEVPYVYRQDFLEAASVISISPKASAALSRRLLQTILREKFNIQDKSLALEIGAFLELKDVPTYLSEAVDAIRNIGNFAAHPIKDTNTGELVDVEPGEAEWLLEVLEALFDFAFVQPIRLSERKKNLNDKLKAVGKPQLKDTGIIKIN